MLISVSDDAPQPGSEDTMTTTNEVAAAKSAGRDAAKIELAYRQLKQDIIAGVYSPNERLVEVPLTARLGISRNTLRSVFARLESESVVVLEPNRGARVRAFSSEEAEDVLRVREVNEGLVASLAAQRATPSQIDALHAAFDAAAEALERDDIVGYSRANRRFHEAVIDAAASPAVAAVLESLHFPLIKFQFQSVLVPGRKTESLAEHRELMGAIEARDAEAAERLARMHIRHVRGTIDATESLSLGVD